MFLIAGNLALPSIWLYLGLRLVFTVASVIVRHPNYAGGFLVSLSSGLVFGSWVAVLPMLVHMVLLMVRAVQEEKMLFGGLPGYSDYAHRLRWRFLPGVW